MYLRTPSAEADLRDLLDRILDKGVSLGAVNLLTLGEINLSDPHTRVSLDSAHLHIGYHPLRQTLSRYAHGRKPRT